jgi:hypothetical protein
MRFPAPNSSVFDRVVKAGALSLLFLAPATLIGGLDQTPRFELCGIFHFGTEGIFNLRDQKTDTVRWVELGKRINGYRVDGYDSKSQRLTLVSRHETLEITLINEALPAGMIRHAQLGFVGVPDAKRPPRPKIREMSRLNPTSSKPDSSVGVLNANRPALQLGTAEESDSAQKKGGTTETAESSQLPDNATIRAKNQTRGQLAYELKVRPPMRVESTDLQTKNLE